MDTRRVIGSEHINDAYARKRQVFEILPGDIVTDMATETAARLKIKLVHGPLEKPVVARTDGATQMRRALTRRSPKWRAPKPVTLRNERRISKIALIGGGGVGGNIAHLAANIGLADEMTIIDLVPGLAEAMALDLTHASGITGSTTRISGGTDLSLVQDAEIVIVTAGRARGPGMTRADLVASNKRVIGSAAEAIKMSAPGAIVIIVTNPLDEMTAEMLKATGFAREKVLGMAGTLDSSRFRTALAKAADVDAGDVTAMTIGAHGDEMVPVPSLSRIKGRPLEVFLSGNEIEACVKDAITGGGQVVAIKKTGSATIAPAHSTLEMIDHIRGARAGVLPVTVSLEGEYGINDTVIGVPCRLGAGGLVRVEEIALSDQELTGLHQAAAAIRSRLEQF